LEKKFIKLFIIFNLLIFLFNLPSGMKWFDNDFLNSVKNQYDFFLSMWLTSSSTLSQVITVQIGKIIAFVLYITIGYVFFKMYKLIKQSNESIDIKKLIFYSFIPCLISFIGISWISIDVFSYIASGWLEFHYNLNPYYDVISSIKNYNSDPMFQNLGWKCESSIFAYGPIIQKILFSACALSFGSVKIALFNIKLFNLVFHLINIFLILKISKKLSIRSDIPVFLYAFNPLILFSYITSAHNDIYMLTFILTALYFIVSKNYIFTLLALSMAINIKYIPVLFVPFVIIYFSKNNDFKGWIKNIIIAAFITIVSTLLLHAVYINNIFDFQTVFQRLSGQNNIIVSSLTFVTLVLFRGTEYMFFEDIKLIQKMIYLYLYSFIIVFCFRDKRKDNLETLLIAMVNAIIIYLIIPSSSIFEWYLPWFMIITIFINDDNYKKLTISLSCIYCALMFFTGNVIPIVGFMANLLAYFVFIYILFITIYKIKDIFKFQKITDSN